MKWFEYKLDAVVQKKKLLQNVPNINDELPLVETLIFWQKTRWLYFLPPIGKNPKHSAIYGTVSSATQTKEKPGVP